MGPVAVDHLEFGNFGPLNDRRYMLVDTKNRFVTQRSHPVLSQFSLAPDSAGWRVSFKNESIVIQDEGTGDRIIETSVWSSDLKTREHSVDVSQWFSNQLDEIVTLVELDDLERRTKRVKNQDKPLMFADGYPLLVCNQRSLDALNQDLSSDMAMKRFRPNVVVDLPVDLEYKIEKLTVSDDAFLQFAKPCVRCNIPAIDPVTGVYHRDFHQRLRKRIHRGDAPIFGMNAAAFGLSKITIGEEFSVS